MPAATYAPLGLAAEDLACSRGGRRIFSGISFRVRPSELLAVKGPNGAGKSTLIRAIAGLLRPDAGRLVIEGHGEAPVAHYFGHADALKPALTLRETLRFWSVVYEKGRAAPDAEIEEAAAAAGIGHALDLPAGVLSAGQRRRAGLARLVLSRRPLWLLDEPSAALDAAGEALLGRLMGEHLQAGGLIVATTHRDLTPPANATVTLGETA